MKIKFHSNDEFPLNKTMKICSVTMVSRAVFHENNNYSVKYFLDECLYKI